MATSLQERVKSKLAAKRAGTNTSTTITNGVSQYRNYYTSGVDRSKSSQNSVQKSNQMQQNAVQNQSKQSVNKYRYERNPEFDKMTDEEKAVNAALLNAGDSRGIKHIRQVDNPLYSGVSINNNRSRDDIMAQYQQGFKDSAYTPTNKYLSDLNQKDNEELISDQFIRNLPESIKKQFGIIDGRAIKRFPTMGQDLLQDLTTATNAYTQGRTATDEEITSAREQNPPSSRNFKSAQDVQQTNQLYNRESNQGIVSARQNEARSQYNEEITSFRDSVMKDVNDLKSKNSSARDQYIGENLEQRIQSSQYASEIDQLNRSIDAISKEADRDEFVKKYYSTESKFMRANDGRSGRSRDYYFQSRMGMSWEEAQNKFNALKEANGGTLSSKYHALKNDWANEKRHKVKELEAQRDKIIQGVKDEIGNEYDNSDAGKAASEELSTKTTAADSQISNRKSELESELAANLAKITNQTAAERNIFNKQKGYFGGTGDDDPLQNIIDSFNSASTGNFELEKKAFETAADIIAREKFELAQSQKRDAYVRQQDRQKQALMEQYENKAKSAKTKAQAERYLAQKEALVNQGYSKSLSEFDEDQSFAAENYRQNFLLEVMSGVMEGAGNGTDLADMQKREKSNYILNYLNNDTGDPLTAVGRALKSYENALKLESSDDKKSELELGNDLDEGLKLFSLQEQGLELTPEQQELIVNPVQAYEWLRSEGATADAANKMLQFRGISAKIIRPQIEEYYRNVMGFSDEEVQKLMQDQATKTMRTKFLNGELSEEEAALYLERVEQEKAAKSSKTVASKYKDGELSPEEEQAYLDRIARESASRRKPGSSNSSKKTTTNTEYQKAQDDTKTRLSRGDIEPYEVDSYLEKFDISTREKEAIKKTLITYDSSTRSYVLRGKIDSEFKDTKKNYQDGVFVGDEGKKKSTSNQFDANFYIDSLINNQ